MATALELLDSLESFAQSCKENERLTAMIKEWNRILHVEATDLESISTLETSNGAVTATDSAVGSPDLVIQSDSDTLTQVFYGELSPNEPYNDGTLRIKGSEEDIVRLDFVIAMLWD
jgi:putative sterol carrier protein